MNKYNTKLGQLLSLLERPRFEKCVKATGADKHCKGFSAWQQFVTMAYAQIANPHGLRSLENSLNANKTCLYHLGVQKEVKRATISYANTARKPEVFEKLFYSLSSALDRNGRKKFRKDFYGIDATELSLNLHDFPWATFRSTKSGVKIHLTYDINNSLPTYLFITNANEHENNTLKKMNIAKGCTVTFDKGYCNYAVFGDFCRDKIFFITRLKENAQYRVIEEHESRDKHITLDRTIEFTGMQTGRKCPFPLRVIKSVDEKTGKEITILTNIFNLTAGYIAGMYRARWNIEIFFKTIKQNLRIKKFFGRTENAVKTQIWIALTVYLLYMKLRQLCIYGGKNFTNFMSELKVCLFERKDLFEWFAGSPPPAVYHPNDFQQELWV